MTKRTVIIFEDTKKKRTELESAFKHVFSKKTKIIFFDPSVISMSDNLDNKEVRKTYEVQIVDYLAEIKVKTSDIALIVTDRDLSKYDNWGGLSEAVTTNLANQFAIPICLYASEDKKYAPSDQTKQKKRWSDFKVILDFGRGAAHLAEESKIFFDGFESIRIKYYKIKSTTLPKSPAEIMAKILNKPKLQDRISLYGAGDQHMAEDILPYAGSVKDIEKRIPRLLGFWLWDSILRYPGIVVYGKAAASYLNINPNDFKKPEIKALFNKALYKGPFAEIQEYWWRDELDSLLYKEKCESGYELAKKKKQDVRDCKCSVDKTLNAGYYCMITQEPVSDKYSQSNISWFPTGADLARISKPEYDKLAPWVGQY